MSLPYPSQQAVALAPMAGITDRPFRSLCRAWGATHAVSEMLTSDPRLWHTPKSRRRMDHAGEPGPRVVQIAGADPEQMARAAAWNESDGAAVIDINMGCPAKKVCRRAAGSALLADLALVERILRAVVGAVSIPVTLKFRTGPTAELNNALQVGELAQRCGIRALALHGRSRADAYRGQAEHRTARALKRAVDIPVFANGDITTPQSARRVLDETGADGLLIARGAQGRPWLFAQIRHYLAHGETLPDPPLAVQRDTLLRHVADIHAHYGDVQGPRIARKHIGWYLAHWPGGEALRREVVRLDRPDAQLQKLHHGLAELAPAQAA